MRNFSNIKTSLIVLCAFALLLMIAMPASAAAYSVKYKLFGFGGTAGETLATGDVVCIKDSDGKVYKADADDSALRPAVGIVDLGAASGYPVEIITHGIFRGWTGLSEGQNAYLSTTAGAVTQSAPAYVQKIAVAVSTTEYLFSFQETLDTSALTVLGILTGATPLIFEGATADDNETTIAVTDPTADRTITLPDASGVPILSTAIPDAAGAVSAAANSLVFEGATADAHETTLTVTDPTADRTITLPDASGTANINCTATHDYAGAAADWTLSVAEAQCGFITVTNASGAVNAILPTAIPGKTYTVNNGSGQVLTFLVSGQTGGSIANGKWAFYTTGAADVLEVYELP